MLNLVNELPKNKPKLLAIFSSGYLDDKTQLSMIKEKGFKFVGKPYSATALLRTIRELLEKK